MSTNSARRLDAAIRTITTLLWPVSSDPLPANPFFTAFFTGLCGFCYRAPNGEVGFHHGDDNHKLQIKIYERPGCKDITPELPERIKRATLEVPSLALSNVSYYEKGSFARLPTDDANDFRWLPDL